MLKKKEKEKKNKNQRMDNIKPYYHSSIEPIYPSREEKKEILTMIKMKKSEEEKE